MKKFLGFVLAVTMVLGLFSMPVMTAAAEGETKVLRVGLAEAGRGEQKVEEGNEYVDENWSTNYIIENFAKPNNIDLRFEIVDNTNGAANQNYVLMLASETAPDLYLSSVGEGTTWVRKLAKDEMLADLRPSLEKYGPHIVDLLGMDFIDMHGTIDGGLYTLPGIEPIPAISHSWIRADWLEILGLEMPTTFDEWYACMVAFKERASELEAAGAINKADEIVPYAMYHTRWFTDWERIVTRFYPAETFDPTSLAYYRSGYGIEYNKEGFKEGMSFMNKMYRDGLISYNFALDTEAKQFDRDITQGNAGCYVNNLFHGWGPSDPTALHNLLAKNIEGARFEYIDCFTNQYDGVARNPLDSVVLNYSIVPYFSEAVDEAIKYLDFTSTPEHNLNIQYGIEGVSYEMTDIGPILFPAEQRMANGFAHRMGANELIFLCRTTDQAWSRVKRAGAKTIEEAEYSELIHKSIEKNGYQRFPLELANVESRNELTGGLRDIWTKFITDLIMAADDDTFEQVWNAGVAELEANGARQILDDITAFYDGELKAELEALYTK